MSLEAYTGKISDLVDSNPTPTDPKSQGDDHLRGIKYTLKQSFPNFTGPVNAKNEAIDQAVSDGLGFCKNKLFNGEVTRINQRGFDGNWATKNTWASGNTIAQQELCYGYDMWAKASATDMLQVIEAGNFRPSTVHTLSGIGVTTQQITSPASGNWVITVPQTASYVQVEEGVEATPFEIRPIGFELAQCQRYYEKSYNAAVAPGTASNNDGMVKREENFNPGAFDLMSFSVAMSAKRTTPLVTNYSNVSGSPGKVRDNVGNIDIAISAINVGEKAFYLIAYPLTLRSNQLVSFHWTASAVI